MKLKFSGINIHSDEPEKTFEFYRKLGFRVLEEVPPGDKWYGAVLALQDENDEPRIWIWRKGEEETAFCNHFVFSAGGDLDAVYQHIIAAGIACEPPFTAAWGGRELTLRDPAGNELLFL